MKSGRDKFKKNKKLICFFSKLLNVFSKKRQEKLFNKFNRGESVFKLVLRYCIMKNLCNSCGDNVLIGEYVTIKHFENISVGSNVSIQKFCYIDATGNVNIGNDVSIAVGCKFFSFNHSWDDEKIPIKYNDLKIGKIIVKDDVWFGADSIVLSDVTIGSRSVIGAKSVVSKNLKGHEIYVGSPASPIKEIR